MNRDLLQDKPVARRPAASAAFRSVNARAQKIHMSKQDWRFTPRQGCGNAASSATRRRAERRRRSRMIAQGKRPAVRIPSTARKRSGQSEGKGSDTQPASPQPTSRRRVVQEQRRAIQHAAFRKTELCRSYLLGIAQGIDDTCPRAAGVQHAMCAVTHGLPPHVLCLPSRPMRLCPQHPRAR